MYMNTTFKRFIAASSAAVLTVVTVAFTPLAMGAAFLDVPSNAWYASYVNKGVDHGFFQTADYYRPADNVNRAELAKLAFLLAQKRGIIASLETAQKSFPDVSSSDWFAPYVNTLANHNIIGGYANGNFGPGDSVTRAQLAKIVTLAAGLSTGDSSYPRPFKDLRYDWSDEYIIAAYNYSIVDGVKDAQGGFTGNFHPSENVSRAAVSKMVINGLNPENRFANNTPTTPTTPTDTTTPPDEVVTKPVEATGTLTFATSPNTPSATVVPKSSASVPYLSFNVSASAGSAITVDSMIIHRVGVGDASDFDGIYIYEGMNRLTDSVTVNSYDNYGRFNNLGITVPAGQTKTLTLRADIASGATSSNQSSFKIQEVQSTALNTIGMLTVEGNAMEVGGTAASGVEVDKSTIADSDISVGDSNVELARFKVTAPSDQELDVSSVTLTNAGNIDMTSLKNFTLELSDGTVVANTDSMRSIKGDDVVVLNFNTPIRVTKGSNKTFSMRGDVTQGKTGETIQFYIDNSADLMAKGVTFGFNVSLDATASDYDTTSGANSATLKASAMTITNNSPAADDIASGADDIILGEYKVYVPSSDIEVKGMNFTITGTGVAISSTTTGNSGADLNDNSTVALNNIRIVDSNGNTLLSDSLSATADNAQTLNFGSGVLTFAAGTTTTLKVVANVPTTTTAGAFTVTLTDPDTGATAWSHVKDLSTGKKFAGDDFDEIVPNADIVSNSMTVSSASLTVGAGSSVTAYSTVVGVDGTDLGAIAFTSGRASDVIVRTLAIQGAFDATTIVSLSDSTDQGNAKTGIAAVYLYNGTTLLGSESFNSSGVATFSNINYVVNAGTTQSLIVRGDILKSAVATSATGQFQFGVSSITAEDESDKSLTATNNMDTSDGNSVTITIQDTGTLSAEKDSSEPTESILVYGTEKNKVGSYRFESVREAFNLTDLTVKLNGTAATHVSKITLTDSNGNTLASSSVSSDEAAFSGMSINIDGAKTINVLADIVNTSNSITTGGTLSVSLGSDTTEVRAVSVGSDTTLIDLNDSSSFVSSDTGSKSYLKDSNTHYLKATKITATSTAVTSSSGQDRPVLQLNIANTANEANAEAEMTQLVLDVTETFTTNPTGYRMYKSGNSGTSVNATSSQASATTGDLLVAGNGTFNVIILAGGADTTGEVVSSVTATSITITAETDGGGAADSTWAEIVTAIAAETTFTGTVTSPTNGADTVLTADAQTISSTQVTFDTSSFTDRFVGAGSTNTYVIEADITADTDGDTTETLQLSLDRSTTTGGTGIKWNDGRNDNNYTRGSTTTAVAQVSTLTLAAALVTSNVVALTINDVNISETFDTSSDNTLANIATAIAAVTDVTTAAVTVVGGNQTGSDDVLITITAATAGTPLDISTVSITAGASQTTAAIATPTPNETDSALEFIHMPTESTTLSGTLIEVK
jgi:hypothetical protein